MFATYQVRNGTWSALALLGCLLSCIGHPAKGATLAPVISVPAPSSHSFYVKVDPSLVAYAQRKKLKLTFMKDSVAKWTKTVDVPNLTAPDGSWVDYTGWGTGACNLLIQIVNVDSSLSPFGDLAHTIPVLPAWTSFVGPTTPLIPDPYTPILVGGNSARVWGRTYSFGNSPFLDQVNSQGLDILYSPVTLTGTVSGVPLAWTIQTWSVTSVADDKVVFTGTATSGSLNVSVTAAIEFDGMVRFDWTISPVGTSKTVRDLALVVPVKKSVAKSFMQSPLQDFDIYNISTWDKSGDLPSTGWKCQFAPLFWLGDQTRGIQWFAESHLNWIVSDPTKYIEVTVDANAATIKCHLIDGSRTITSASPLSYTFGLVASPIRPRKSACDMSGDRIAVPFYPEGLVNVISSRPGITIPASYEEFTPSGCVEADFRVDWNPAAPAAADTDISLLGMVCVGGNSDIWARWYWNGSAGYLRLTQNAQGTSHIVAQVPVSLVKGTWHRLALNYGTTTQVYLDGVPLISATLPGAVPTFVIMSPFFTSYQIGDLPLARWRISNTQRLASELQPGSAWVADSKTTHIEVLQSDPTPMNLTNPVFGNTSCPGYLEGNWTYDSANHWLLPGADGQSMTGIERMHRIGVKGIVYFNWSTLGGTYGPNGIGHGEPYNPAAFAQMGTLCNMYGMHLMPYTPWGVPDPEPWFNDYIWEQLYSLGTSLPDAYTEGIVKFYGACAGSSEAQFNLSEIDHMMSLGATGVFLDGVHTGVSACGNPVHGHGVTDPLTGQPTSISRIFDQREYMKKLTRLIRSYRSDAVIDAHESSGFALPTMSFVDVVTNGEAMWASGDWKSLAQPAVFRADYMGRQFGFNADALFYNNGRVDLEWGMALAGIHGQTPRCSWGMYETRAYKVWGLVDSFDTLTANWMPYYEPATNAFTPASSSVLASAFVHPGKSALVLVTNWSDAATNNNITINWAALGLPSTSPVKVINWNEMLPVTAGNVIAPPLKQRRLTYLLIGEGVVDPTSTYIYYDDFQVNDYSQRYTSDLAPSWGYADLGSGNQGLSPAAGSWHTAFSTKDYKNGRFADTSYTARLKVRFPNNASPSVSLWLLNNGWCPQGSGVAPAYYGYEAQVYNSGGSLVLKVNRTNTDGTVTNLYNNTASPYSDVNLSAWSTMSAKVIVATTETGITLTFDGVRTNGMPVTYSCEVHDTAAQRWASGAGIAVRGYPGTSSGGLLIDDLVVVGSYAGIKAAKLAPENMQVSLDGAVISRSFTDSFYVESDDRSYGMRVSWPSNRLAAGSRVKVTGLVSTTAEGERYIIADSAVKTGTGSVLPLAMTNRSLGGSDWNYEPLSGTGQQGVSGGIGPCNIGLLVRTTGKVTSQITGGFNMTDGSGAEISVIIPTSISAVPTGTYVSITAISSCKKATDGSLLPLLLVRSSSDIVRIVEP